MSGHTPGPWRLKPGANDGNMIVSADGKAVGTAYFREDLAEMEANRALMIAAPDLLDRLKKLGMQTRDGYCFCDPEKAPDPHPEWCRNASAAIAKAESK